MVRTVRTNIAELRFSGNDTANDDSSCAIRKIYFNHKYMSDSYQYFLQSIDSLQMEYYIILYKNACLNTVQKSRQYLMLNASTKFQPNSI